MPYQPVHAAAQRPNQNQIRPDSGKFDLLSTGSIQSTNLRNLQQLSLNSPNVNSQNFNGSQEAALIEPARKAPQVPEQRGGISKSS